MILLNASPVNRETSERSLYDPLGLIAFALLGGLLSLIVIGYIFGGDNNFFHLPIVAQLYNEPQFAHDPFIQSLRFYASGFWFLLKGSDHYIDPAWLFLVCLYFSRVVLFTGFLACADRLGIRSRRQRLIFILMLSFTSLLRGSSYAGNGELFIPYFSHSEIASGLNLISLSFIIRGRLASALVTNGLVFFVNAFVGVWNFVPSYCVTGFLWIHKKIGAKEVLIGGLTGSLIFLVIVAPVLSNIFSNPDFGQKLDYDYVYFLELYWPFHFLFSSHSKI